MSTWVLMQNWQHCISMILIHLLLCILGHSFARQHHGLLQQELTLALQLPLQYNLGLIILGLESNMSQTEPGVPLSSEELTRLILRHNYETTCELIREERQSTNYKTKKVIDDLTPYFGTVVGQLNTFRETQEQKIAELEQKIQASHFIEDKLPI